MSNLNTQRKMMKTLFTALLLFMPFGLFASSFSEGSAIEAMRFKDQFEKEMHLNAQTKQLIIAFSKAQGEKVKAFLDANPNYLKEQNALYIMDATAVPSMVMSLFMLPKFKKYPYAIGLVEDEKVVARLPKKEEHITVISLDNLTVTSVVFKEAL